MVVAHQQVGSREGEMAGKDNRRVQDIVSVSNPTSTAAERATLENCVKAQMQGDYTNKNVRWVPQVPHKNHFPS